MATHEHTTNYPSSFIAVAEDCPAHTGVVPPDKTPPTAARLEYDMVINCPYRFTSDQVIYEANGRAKGLSREEFFEHGRPCLRSSALTKRHGWGVHSDALGRIALYAVDSAEYARWSADPTLHQLRALRSHHA